MEMALRPQSPLCPLSRPAVFVRPAGSRGGGLAQSFLLTGRFTGSRIVRCMSASSDYPNRKSWRMVSPHIRFTASRGYAPRLTAESSTKKREHSKSDEETLGTYNRLLSIDTAEWTGSREVETAEVDLSQNASSSSTMGEVDAADEDIFEVDLPGNSLSSVTMGEVDAVDEAWLEEDIFEVDMPGNALSSLTMGEVDAVEEAGVEENIFEVDLSGNALSNVTMGGVNAVDKAGVEEDIFEVDLSETAFSSVAMGEVNAVDEAGAEEDIFEVDLSGLALSRATMEEVDVVDEAGSVKDTFEADLSGNFLSNATYGEVNAMDETMAEEVTFDMDLSGNSSSCARLEEVVGARAEEETFEMDLLGSVSGNAKQMAVDSVGKAIAKEETYQQHPALSSTSMEGKAIDDTPASLKPELMPLVRVQEQDKSIFGVHEQEGSIVNFHEQNQSMVDFHEQEQPITAFDKQHQPIARFPKQDQSIAGFPEQNQSIVASHKQDQSIVDLPEENQSIIGSHEQDKSIVDVPDQIQSIVDSSKQHQSIVAFHKQDRSIVDVPEQIQSIVGSSKQHQSIVAFRKQNQSIVDVPEQIQSIVGSSKQDQSIVAFRKQNQSIVDVPEQIQSIVGSSKQDQSIVAFCKQNQSIVDVPEQIQSIVGSSKQHLSIVASRKQDQSIVSAPVQKQSIVGFHKQDLSIVGFSKQNLSIVGTSGESQTKQVASVARHDALHVKGVEAKDGDYTSQKTDGDVLHVKFDVDNLLQRHMADSTKEAVEMTTSKKVYEEHLSMTEDQMRTSAAEEQRMVTEDGLSIAEVEVGMVDKLQHVLSEEELSWAEDEVGLIEDEEHYEVDETSTSAEPDIHESPQEDVDPQALRMMLQELADKKYSMGNKLFVFPEVVKADSVIDLYLNRDLSALASEPDVLIKGAFNGWRWRLFTERLHKSELGGDWWHCKLYIPTQAYRLDFVFFNGRTVYENNDSNDFVIQIESTMDEYLFENFLVEEKQRELERLAIEETERRRQAEEQQRREEERAADEADRAQAKAEVEMKKNKFHNVLGSARTCADNLWYIEPTTHRQEDTVRLYYNRYSRPLVHSSEIWMHGGYNNWTNGLSIAERLVQCDDKDGDWWYADVILPEKAFVLDWVFADGPPGNARNYDNNGRQDFHAILPNVMTEENYWVEEEQSIYTRLLQERREREEAMKRKAERSAKMKAEMKEKTMRMFLLSQKHIVYTEPLEIRAGTTVDVLYNPYNTVLNGKPEVWFRFSFNRWTHPGGVLPPQKMVKAKDGSLLKATVSVPLDAYMMDFVFSESEEGGIYDNRNGVDYHIPVSGSIAKEPPMHIVHIAVEMAPVAKVGGLGDVVTSLSRAVQDLGHNVEVILPKYDCLNLSNVRNLHLHQSFSWGGTEIKVWFGLVEDLSVYFLEPQNGMFGVGCVYGRNDDRRFGFFCHSALEFLLQNGSSPHIIHCHDWSSAPVAWLYKEHYAQSRLADARVVFTIHNLEFGAYYIGKAMTYCDKATTVSHTYSREVSGHGAIAPQRGKFYGILNGIDQDIWDPYTDNFIPVHYSSENVVEGKNAAKKALQQKLGLQQTDVPIVGIVTRLTAQKGIHLIKHAIHWTLEHNGQVVLLGSAPDPRIQSDFCNLANTLHGVNHGRVRLCLTYDEPLSHLIYAGSDFILVPSIFEPCGLTQLVAMRYGSIPVVRRTGGLYDTVFDVDNDKDRARSHGLEPNGFSFDGADSNGVDYGLNRAISAWFDARDWFHSLCKRVMEQDWSWNRPALDYLELYHSARKF